MNILYNRSLTSDFDSRKYRVKKCHLIDSSLFLSSMVSSATSENCCLPSNTLFNKNTPDEIKTEIPLENSVNIGKHPSIIDVLKERTNQQTAPNKKLSSTDSLVQEACPIDHEQTKSTTVTLKHCQFANEPISIKPITAGIIFIRLRSMFSFYSETILVPGIGKCYGQRLAEHGFIYARQLLGYYILLKDMGMFQKWLEDQFDIPKHRTVESKEK